ncbi:MAG: glycosyltransferase family 39 protein [Patescibacteria group bacterium]
MLKKYSYLIVGIILTVFFVVSLVVSSQESTIMDEQAHIPAAYTYVRYGDMRLNPEHPPLLKDLAGVPLLFLDVKFPTDDPSWTESVNAQWDLGNKFIHSNDANAIDFWSRLPIILIAVLLGIFIFKWSKEISGTIAGLFALVLYSADPNILGHNHYVTTDLGIAAFIFFSFYYFIRFLKNPSWKNVIFAGIALGLAQLTKFSGVLLFPLFTLLVVLFAFIKRRPGYVTEKNDKQYRLSSIWEYFSKYAIVIVICFAAIWILYAFNTFNMPPEKLIDNTTKVFSDEGIAGIARSVVFRLNASPVLRPLAEYFLGVFMVFIRVTGGNTYYFFGTVTNHATPLYFPAVFALKETLPFLFLMIFAIFYALFQFGKKFFLTQENKIKFAFKELRTYLEGGVAYYSMFAFILMYSYISITGNLNIGFRHLFPVLPFAYVLIAKKVFDAIKNSNREHSQKTLGIITAILAIWIIAIPIIHYPGYISYFNEFIGGPRNGYKYVTDSNVDWGQDAKRLGKWVDDYNKNNPVSPINKIRVDYFGGADPKFYLGDKFIPWTSSYNPEPGWYAICAGFLQEGLYKQKEPGEKDYRWLLPYQKARVGDSIFVYYVP